MKKEKNDKNVFTKLDLLKLAQEQDVEAYEPYELLDNDESNFKQKYNDFYDDVKQPSKYIKEDW